MLLIAQYSQSQTINKIIIDSSDTSYGYYLAVPPSQDSIGGVIILFAGYGQQADCIFPETRIQNIAYNNNILTIAYSPGSKLYVDSATEKQLNTLFNDILKRYNITPEKFILGGFSAGGVIALRYTELCKQYPLKYPIDPKGVFMVDSPIDIFTLWTTFEQYIAEGYSEPAIVEAKNAMRIMTSEHGNPFQNIRAYAAITPFSMNKAYGTNEIHLKQTAVRAYHDIDVAWRIINRHQTVNNSNYAMTAELINRLLLMGNTRAEFIQSTRKGYRNNGMRHPHSWSIVDEVECIQWIKTLLQ